MERLSPEGKGKRLPARVAVDGIADERVPRLGEMDADLVRPPRPEARFDEGRDSEPLDDLPLRHGADSGLARLGDAAPPVAAVLDEILVEGAGVPGEIALHDGEVAAVHRVSPELCLQFHEAAARPREDENSRRLLVEPVDDGDVGPSPAAVAPLNVRRDLGEESLLLLRLGRVRQERGRLDDGDGVVVLVEHRETRLDAAADLSASVPDRARVVGHERTGVVDDLARDRDLSLENRPLQPRRRDVGVELLETADDPEGAHGGILARPPNARHK